MLLTITSSDIVYQTLIYSFQISVGDQISSINISLKAMSKNIENGYGTYHRQILPGVY